MSAVKKIFYVYSEIFFADNFLLGIIVAAASFIDINVGLAGMVSLAAAYCFGRNGQPVTLYNSLLVGFSIGALYKISILTVAIAAVAGVLAFMFTITTAFFLKKYTGLPVLSTPFVIVSSLVYLATMRNSDLYYNHLHVTAPVPELNLPDWINGYFISMGSILFIKEATAGILIAAALFLHSRLMFLLSLVGYYGGAALVGSFNSVLVSQYSNLNYFNFILVAMAVGSIFLIPSPRSFGYAMLAIAISFVVLNASEAVFKIFGIPVLTLPFNVVVLSFIYYSAIVRPRLQVQTFMANPESTLDHYLSYIKRFEIDLPSISLPFNGEWKISQGFDDEPTHKGAWKYGVDFVIVNDRGEQFASNPKVVDSYIAFGKPVLAPVTGTVISVVNDEDDNEIDSVNRRENWGNNILILDARGFYVKLCHLKKGSVVLKPGSIVEAGQVVALCGNSGYSPAPHIHVQVQTGPQNAAPTTQFGFEQVVTSGGEFRGKSLPEKGASISALLGSSKKRKLFELLLKDSFEYEVIRRRGERVVEQSSVKLDVVLDEDGVSCLTDGQSRLYFEVCRDVFRFYKFVGGRDSVLHDIFLAIPSIVLTDAAVRWSDFLPLGVGASSLFKNVVLLLQSVAPGVSVNKADLEYVDDSEFRSTVRTEFRGKEISRAQISAKLHDVKFVEKIVITAGKETIDITRI